jgi:predicted secreted hydrolase
MMLLKRQTWLIFGLLIATSVVIVSPSHLGQSKPRFETTIVPTPQSTLTSDSAQALHVREFTFPKDHGAHPEYGLEWWYFVGNVADADNRRFGFQLTFFRHRGPMSSSEQAYLADFAITVVASNRLYSNAQASLGAFNQAGVVTDPRLRIWLKDWAISAIDGPVPTFHLKAERNPIAIDLTAKQLKPPALNGDRGLSQKSSDSGRATYYYSLTRLETEGTITVNGTRYRVAGNAWMDHEFGTSSLGGAVGWDWFGLQLDNGRELMIYLIRNADGSTVPQSQGTLVEADGTYSQVTLDKIKVTVLDTWKSPHTKGVYPSGWHVTVQAPTGPIILNVTPLVNDQELGSVIPYWEGASRISGTDNGKSVAGFGYVELTGYTGVIPQ